MVTIRIGEVRVRSLGDAQFRSVLEAAGGMGGAPAFPLLCALTDTDSETDPAGLMDEIVRLSAGNADAGIAVLLGQLRDDLLEAVSVASEG